MYDVCVAGGGPAGMAAALAAKEAGAGVVLVEREGELGGILNQCIHSGFGLHYFKTELTGPEYAERFADKVRDARIEVRLNTAVFEIGKEKNGFTVYTCSRGGIEEIKSKAVILASGCRERSAGAINLCGARPAGIIAAGAAQRLINIDGQKIGGRAVIVGSGDIGLIMARRFTLEGGTVAAVLEIKPESGGLKRNIAQCLDDFNIPLLLSTAVTRIKGARRVEGVYYAQVDGALNAIPETEKFIECDTVLLSVGLVPETELFLNLGVKSENGLIVTDENKRVITEDGHPLGAFVCGNARKVHDLADRVTEEGFIAGASAAKFAGCVR